MDYYAFNPNGIGPFQPTTEIPVASISFDTLIDKPSSKNKFGYDVNFDHLKNPIDPESPMYKRSAGINLNSLIREDVTPACAVSPDVNNLIAPDLKPEARVLGIQEIFDSTAHSMLPKVNNETTSHLNNVDSKTPQLINWFTRLLEKRGNDFIDAGHLTADEVSKNTERIIDDILFGRIDYNKQGKYIIRPEVIETLINYCNNKLALNKAILFSLGYLYNDYTNIRNLYDDQTRIANLVLIDDNMSREVTKAISIVTQDIGIYEILLSKLNAVNQTKNASVLFNLTNDLMNYRKLMKKRF